MVIWLTLPSPSTIHVVYGCPLIPFTCFSLIKPQITFNESLDHLSFQSLMQNYSSTVGPGIQLGKENGLTLLLDAEVYDYNFRELCILIQRNIWPEFWLGLHSPRVLKGVLCI